MVAGLAVLAVVFWPPLESPLRSPAERELYPAMDDDAPPDWQRWITAAGGTRHEVATPEQFRRAAQIVKPGDLVIIRNGRYARWSLTVSRSGTAERPIVYTAERPNQGVRRGGGVVFTDTFRLRVTGDHNVIGGFVFEGIHGHDAIEFDGASHNRFTDNQFFASGRDPYQRLVSVVNGADANRFDHNLMSGNRSFGMAVVLPVDGKDTFAYSRRNRFDHNVFERIPTRGGKIPIQIGQYANRHSRGETWTVIDHNEFRDCRVTVINSKSNRELIAFNRFLGTGDAVAIALRAGNDKRVIGNRIVDAGTAMRIYGTGHEIVNNIIRGGRYAVQIPAWGDYSIGPQRLSTSGPTGGLLIAHNTIIGAQRHAVEVGRPWGYRRREGYTIALSEPFDLRIVNNIFSGEQGVLVRIMSGASVVLQNNLYEVRGTAQPGSRGTGSVMAPAALDRDLAPRPGSPAVDRGVPLQEVPDDFFGAGRDRKPDLGAIERRVSHRGET